MCRRVLSTAIFSALTIGLIAPASAGFVTIYDNEAAFTANLAPGYYLEEFASYTYGNPFGDIPIVTEADFGPINGYQWHASTFSGISGLWSNPNALSTHDSNDLLTITFTGAPVTAVGGTFSATDFDGNIIAGSDVTVTLNDGTFVTFQGPRFTGFTSLVPISSLTVGVTQEPSFSQVAHFYAGAAAVPEPSSLALLGIGGCIAGIRTAWRRRSQKQEATA